MSKQYTWVSRVNIRRCVSLVTILIFSLLVATCDNKPKQKLVPRSIKIYEVKKASDIEFRRLSGTAQPSDFVDLSFSVGGHIEMIHSKLGEQINQGALLASLKKKKFMLRVDAASATFEKAKAVLFEKTRRYIASQKLYKDHYLSELDFRRVEADYKVAQNQLSLAKSELEIAKDNLSKADLYAPYDGRVAQVYVSQHMEVRPGQAIMKFHGLKKFEVTVDVPDTLINKLKLEDKVDIEYVTLSNQKGIGRVTEIATHSALSNAFPVVIAINHPPLTLRSGMIVEVIFGFKLKVIKRIYLVPITAVLPGRTQTEGYVFIYDPKTQTVKKHYVQAALVRDNFLEITRGLNEGDKIAISGVRFLHDGQKVSLYQKAND